MSDFKIGQKVIVNTGGNDSNGIISDHNKINDYKWEHKDGSISYLVKFNNGTAQYIPQQYIKGTEYGINWKDIDLDLGYEKCLNMLDPYDFDTLLLEVKCNLPKINRETVKAQAMESLQSKFDTAKEILNNNLDNLVKYARKERQNK